MGKYFWFVLPGNRQAEIIQSRQKGTLRKMKAVIISCLIVFLADAAGVVEGLPPYIQIRVTNKLTSNFDKRWSIYVGSQQTLFDGMMNLQKNDTTFSFASEPYPKLGQYVISICHMIACEYAHQYWELFGTDHKPLSKGVSQIYPRNGDSYLFNLTISK